MTKPSRAMLAQTLGFILLVAGVLFGAAGRTHVPIFWAYLGVLAAVSVAGLFLIDEDSLGNAFGRVATRQGRGSTSSSCCV